MFGPSRSTARRAVALSTATAVIALSGTLIAASPASAKGGGKARVVTTHGTCSNGAAWKLKAKADNSRLEVEFEVDTNRNGQAWAVRLTDNGVRVFSGTRVTKAPSGSFSVNRLIANRSGADRIVAKATRGSASCVGRLTY